MPNYDEFDLDIKKGEEESLSAGSSSKICSEILTESISATLESWTTAEECVTQGCYTETGGECITGECQTGSLCHSYCGGSC